MQVQYVEPEMKRDMDLIRDLLMGIEADRKLDGTTWLHPDNRDNLGVIGTSDYSDAEIGYHPTLLIEAGLVKGKTGVEVMPAINRLTWQGHEFLPDIRDPGVWAKTKERLRDLPAVGIAVIGEIAKAEIKRHLNLP